MAALADAFAVVGLGEPFRLLHSTGQLQGAGPSCAAAGADDCGTGYGPNLAPITDITVIQPQRDTSDNGYEIIAETVCGHDADVNRSGRMSVRCYLSFTRDPSAGAPIVDVGLFSGRTASSSASGAATSSYSTPSASTPRGWTVARYTTDGHDANLRAGVPGAAPVYLMFRRAPKRSPGQTLGSGGAQTPGARASSSGTTGGNSTAVAAEGIYGPVSDVTPIIELCVIDCGRGESAPATYVRLPARLNRGSSGSNAVAGLAAAVGLGTSTSSLTPSATPDNCGNTHSNGVSSMFLCYRRASPPPHLDRCHYQPSVLDHLLPQQHQQPSSSATTAPATTTAGGLMTPPPTASPSASEALMLPQGIQNFVFPLGVRIRQGPLGSCPNPVSRDPIAASSRSARGDRKHHTTSSSASMRRLEALSLSRSTSGTSDDSTAAASGHVVQARSAARRVRSQSRPGKAKHGRHWPQSSIQQAGSPFASPSLPAFLSIRKPNESLRGKRDSSSPRPGSVAADLTIRIRRNLDDDTCPITPTSHVADDADAATIPGPKYHTFVLTREDGSHRYGHCLTFYEKLSPAEASALWITWYPACSTLRCPSCASVFQIRSQAPGVPPTPAVSPPGAADADAASKTTVCPHCNDAVPLTSSAKKQSFLGFLRSSSTPRGRDAAGASRRPDWANLQVTTPRAGGGGTSPALTPRSVATPQSSPSGSPPYAGAAAAASGNAADSSRRQRPHTPSTPGSRATSASAAVEGLMDVTAAAAPGAPTLYAQKALCFISKYPHPGLFRKLLLHLYALAGVSAHGHGDYRVPLRLVPSILGDAKQAVLRLLRVTQSNTLEDSGAGALGTSHGASQPYTLLSLIQHVLGSAIPVPVPSHTLRVPMLPWLPPAVCTRNDVRSLPYPGCASFITLVQCLSGPSIATALKLMLLEHKVVLHCTTIAILAPVADALRSLMFPLSWQYAYLPSCPASVRGFLECPTAFLIGLSTSLLPAYSALAEDVFLIDLDRDRITRGWSHPPIVTVPSDAPHSNTHEVIPKAVQRRMRRYAHDDMIRGADVHGAPFVRTQPGQPPNQQPTRTSLGRGKDVDDDIEVELPKSLRQFLIDKIEAAAVRAGIRPGFGPPKSFHHVLHPSASSSSTGAALLGASLMPGNRNVGEAALDAQELSTSSKCARPLTLAQLNEGLKASSALEDQEQQLASAVRDAALRVMCRLLAGYRSHVIWKPPPAVVEAMDPPTPPRQPQPMHPPISAARRQSSGSGVTECDEIDAARDASKGRERFNTAAEALRIRTTTSGIHDPGAGTTALTTTATSGASMPSSERTEGAPSSALHEIASRDRSAGSDAGITGCINDACDDSTTTGRVAGSGTGAPGGIDMSMIADPTKALRQRLSSRFSGEGPLSRPTNAFAATLLPSASDIAAEVQQSGEGSNVQTSTMQAAAGAAAVAARLRSSSGVTGSSVNDASGQPQEAGATPRRPQTMRGPRPIRPLHIYSATTDTEAAFDGEHGQSVAGGGAHDRTTDGSGAGVGLATPQLKPTRRGSTGGIDDVSMALAASTCSVQRSRPTPLAEAGTSDAASSGAGVGLTPIAAHGVVAVGGRARAPSSLSASGSDRSSLPRSSPPSGAGRMALSIQKPASSPLSLGASQQLCFIFDTRRFLACAPIEYRLFLRELVDLQGFISFLQLRARDPIHLAPPPLPMASPHPTFARRRRGSSATGGELVSGIGVSPRVPPSTPAAFTSRTKPLPLSFAPTPRAYTPRGVQPGLPAWAASASTTSPAGSLGVALARPRGSSLLRDAIVGSASSSGSSSKAAKPGSASASPLQLKQQRQQAKLNAWLEFFDACSDALRRWPGHNEMGPDIALMSTSQVSSSLSSSLSSSAAGMVAASSGIGAAFYRLLRRAPSSDSDAPMPCDNGDEGACITGPNLIDIGQYGPAFAAASYGICVCGEVNKQALRQRSLLPAASAAPASAEPGIPGRRMSAPASITIPDLSSIPPSDNEAAAHALIIGSKCSKCGLVWARHASLLPLSSRLPTASGKTDLAPAPAHCIPTSLLRKCDVEIEYGGNWPSSLTVDHARIQSEISTAVSNLRRSKGKAASAASQRGAAPMASGVNAGSAYHPSDGSDREPVEIGALPRNVDVAAPTAGDSAHAGSASVSALSATACNKVASPQVPAAILPLASSDSQATESSFQEHVETLRAPRLATPSAFRRKFKSGAGKHNGISPAADSAASLGSGPDPSAGGGRQRATMLAAGRSMFGFNADEAIARSDADMPSGIFPLQRGHGSAGAVVAKKPLFQASELVNRTLSDDSDISGSDSMLETIVDDSGDLDLVLSSSITCGAAQIDTVAGLGSSLGAGHHARGTLVLLQSASSGDPAKRPVHLPRDRLAPSNGGGIVGSCAASSSRDDCGDANLNRLRKAAQQAAKEQSLNRLADLLAASSRERDRRAQASAVTAAAASAAINAAAPSAAASSAPAVLPSPAWGDDVMIELRTPPASRGLQPGIAATTAAVVGSRTAAFTMPAVEAPTATSGTASGLAASAVAMCVRTADEAAWEHRGVDTTSASVAQQAAFHELHAYATWIQLATASVARAGVSSNSTLVSSQPSMAATGGWSQGAEAGSIDALDVTACCVALQACARLAGKCAAEVPPLPASGTALTGAGSAMVVSSPRPAPTYTPKLPFTLEPLMRGVLTLLCDRLQQAASAAASSSTSLAAAWANRRDADLDTPREAIVMTIDAVLSHQHQNQLKKQLKRSGSGLRKLEQDATAQDLPLLIRKLQQPTLDTVNASARLALLPAPLPTGTQTTRPIAAVAATAAGAKPLQPASSRSIYTLWFECVCPRCARATTAHGPAPCKIATPRGNYRYGVGGAASGQTVGSSLVGPGVHSEEDTLSCWDAAPATSSTPATTTGAPTSQLLGQSVSGAAAAQSRLQSLNKPRTPSLLGPGRTPRQLPTRDRTGAVDADDAACASSSSVSTQVGRFVCGGCRGILNPVLKQAVWTISPSSGGTGPRRMNWPRSSPIAPDAGGDDNDANDAFDDQYVDGSAWEVSGIACSVQPYMAPVQIRQRIESLLSSGSLSPVNDGGTTTGGGIDATAASRLQAVDPAAWSNLLWMVQRMRFDPPLPGLHIASRIRGVLLETAQANAGMTNNAILDSSAASETHVLPICSTCGDIALARTQTLLRSAGITIACGSPWAPALDLCPIPLGIGIVMPTGNGKVQLTLQRELRPLVPLLAVGNVETAVRYYLAQRRIDRENRAEDYGDDEGDFVHSGDIGAGNEDGDLSTYSPRYHDDYGGAGYGTPHSGIGLRNSTSPAVAKGAAGTGSMRRRRSSSSGGESAWDFGVYPLLKLLAQLYAPQALADTFAAPRQAARSSQQQQHRQSAGEKGNESKASPSPAPSSSPLEQHNEPYHNAPFFTSSASDAAVLLTTGYSGPPGAAVLSSAALHQTLEEWVGKHQREVIATAMKKAEADDAADRAENAAKSKSPEAQNLSALSKPISVSMAQWTGEASSSASAAPSAPVPPSTAASTSASSPIPADELTSAPVPRKSWRDMFKRRASSGAIIAMPSAEASSATASPLPADGLRRAEAGSLTSAAAAPALPKWTGSNIDAAAPSPLPTPVLNPVIAVSTPSVEKRAAVPASGKTNAAAPVKKAIGSRNLLAAESSSASTTGASRSTLQQGAQAAAGASSASTATRVSAHSVAQASRLTFEELIAEVLVAVSMEAAEEAASELMGQVDADANRSRCSGAAGAGDGSSQPTPSPSTLARLAQSARSLLSPHDWPPTKLSMEIRRQIGLAPL